MTAAVDRLLREIEDRFKRLKDLNDRFGFLLDVERLLADGNEAKLRESCTRVGDFYNSDIDGKELFDEVLDCRMLLRSREEINIQHPQELLSFIVQYGGADVFPNLRVAIQIMLTVAISIASCERSFSKLKLILTYLRSTMGQARLSALALLSIEREEADKIDFSNIIDAFADSKTRKVQLK